MCFLTIVVGVCFLSVARATVTNVEDAKSYLIQYGYIGNDSLTEFNTAIMEFQEKYNLLIDGELNEETLKLMNRLRCMKGENDFRVVSKWNKMSLIWYFPQSNEEYRKLATKAFQIWEEKSNLRFSYVLRPVPVKPDITITIQKRDHWFRANCQGSHKCPLSFDGPGTKLAHGYNPTGDECREIHIDGEENWYLGTDGNVPKDQLSFLMTLTHEIGHVLGLSHSDSPSAIMFPWYQQNITSLSSDDVTAIQYLYGVVEKVPFSKVSATTARITRVPTITTTPTTTTLKPKTQITIQNSNDVHVVNNLCELSHPDVIFLAYAPHFPSHRLYVMYKHLVWKLDLTRKKIPAKPEEINLYLPRGLSKVTHVFQDATGDLFVTSENKFYLVSFPDLNIKQNIDLNLPKDSKINVVFQSNTGQNYIWYNNNTFIEFSMNDFHVMSRGRIKDMFPGVPEDISSAFRHIDGHLYFFRHNLYFKYNEFLRQVVKAAPFTWSILGIPCPDKALLEQLKSTLTKIINLYE